MTSPISAFLVLRRPSTMPQRPVRPLILISTSIEVGGVRVPVPDDLSDSEGSCRDDGGGGDGKAVVGIDADMSW